MSTGASGHFPGNGRESSCLLDLNVLGWEACGPFPPCTLFGSYAHTHAMVSEKEEDDVIWEFTNYKIMDVSLVYYCHDPYSFTHYAEIMLRFLDYNHIYKRESKGRKVIEWHIRGFKINKGSYRKVQQSIHSVVQSKWNQTTKLFKRTAPDSTRTSSTGLEIEW